MSAKTATYEDNNPYNPADSVFVTANAGAGKTTLLTGRVLSLLLSGVAPSKIFCLTFTKAAAAEMSSRVLHKLGGWVMGTDEQLANELQTLLRRHPTTHEMECARSLFAKVLESPEGVRIQTIHGLCQSLLRRFPLEAGVSPHFNVMDSFTQDVAKREACEKLMATAMHNQELLESVQLLSRLQGENNFYELLEKIFGSRGKMNAVIQSPEMAEAALWRLCGLARGTTAQQLFDKHFAYTPAKMAAFRALIEPLSNGKKDDKKSAEGLTKWLESPTVDNFFASSKLWFNNDGAPRKDMFNKDALTDPQKELLIEDQQRALGLQQGLRALQTVTDSLHLYRVAANLLDTYNSIKSAHAMLDYDDQISLAYRLLASTNAVQWVLFKLDGGIDHLLVDEAQDTSPTQWQIIAALTQEFYSGEGRHREDRSIFIVGDEKQSIFSFQGAQPLELQRWQDEFQSRALSAGKSAFRLDRSISYRSSAQVLTAVDAVFSQPEASRGVTFNNAPIAHQLFHKDKPGLVECWPLLAPPPKDAEEEDEEEQQFRAVPRFAGIVADNVRRWIESGLKVKGRAIEPGDIMILLRARGKLAEPLVRALKRRGIEVAGQDRMKLKDNLAVQDMMALAQVLLLPEEDIIMAALLRSPLFDITEHDLFTLAYDRGRLSLWERMGQERGTNPRVADAYDKLSRWRALADTLRPYELFSHVLEASGGRSRIIGRMGGEYQEALDEFLAQSVIYEKSNTPSLQGYLHWLNTSSCEIKRDMEQAQGCVRILTVHASKGLEAPVVILPDTVDFGQKHSSEMIYWQETGTCTLPVLCIGEGGKSAAAAQLKAARREENEAEGRRLLYVALTRASEQLYICGVRGAKKAPAHSWHTLVQSGLQPIATTHPCPWSEEPLLRVGDAPETGAQRQQRPAAPAAAASILKPLPTEPNPPQPLVPSRTASPEAAAASPLAAQAIYQRGRLMHQLLQYLPELPPERWPSLAQRITTPHRATLSEEALEAAVREARAVLEHPDFAFLFGAGSQAEVPVAGLIEVAGSPFAVSGQIDRLYVGEKEVWIVDFKSNQTLPENLLRPPAEYARQLRTYQLLIERIYKEKTVRCALLWTALPKLVPLPQSLLDEATPSTYI